MTEQERAVIDAARAWLKRWKDQLPAGHDQMITPGSALRPLQDAIEALDAPSGPRTDLARPMTWGTVPAGWYVQVPRTGEWFEVEYTLRSGARQSVGLLIAGQPFTHPRDPQGAVTACPGPPNATDAAIEALGFPEILEDGS